MKQGNVLIIAMIFIAICMVIILFVAGIFVSHVNTVLYHFKLEMYTINKAAVVAVNKTKTSMDHFSYHKKSYQQQFENALKTSYHLNDNFENANQLIKKVTIKEYELYEKGKKDTYTKETCDDRVIHTVVEVKMKPIIFDELLEKAFTFTIHEDVNLNTAYRR